MPYTTNIYDIHLRLTERTPFAVPVSEGASRQVKPPVLMRGVPAILRLHLYNDDGLLGYDALSALYSSFVLVIANDFDTAEVLVSDEGGCYLDSEDGAIVCPISAMNTEELEALIGVKADVCLGAELQCYNSEIQEQPIVAYQFPCAVQNRRGGEEIVTPTPVSLNYYTKSETDSAIASAIASAQGLAAMDYITLSGAAGTVEPGKVYRLTMTEDFTLDASSVDGYGESVIFVTPGSNTFSVADGITLDAEMSNFSTYRLMISWTPIGVLVEQTGEWLDD